MFRLLLRCLNGLPLLVLSIVYTSARAQQAPCGVTDQPLTPAQQQLYASLKLADTTSTRLRIAAGDRRECLLAIDVDYLMYKAFNGNIGQIRQTVYEAIAEASAIYERELNIKLTITAIKIWNTQDPYPQTQSNNDHLAAVQDWWYTKGNGASVKKNIVLALSGKVDAASGGVAYIGSQGLGKTALVDYNPGAEISAISYYTLAIAHELGHSFGSVHTHNCSWPGGAIDLCEKTEGTCYSGARIYQVGTVMSYCLPTMPTFHPLCLQVMNANAALANLTSFTLVPAAPTFAGADLTDARPDPYINWNWTDRTQTYRLQVSNDNQFTTVLTDSTVRFPQLQLSGLASGQYFIRVKARNDLGESNWSAPARLTLTVPTVMGVPKLRFPTRNAINVTSGELSWEPVDGATGYQVQTSYLSSFAATYEDKTTTTNRYQMTGSSTSCSYCLIYWRVRATQNGQNSDWSPIGQFRRLPRLTTAYPDSVQGTTDAFQTAVPIMWGDNTGQEAVSTIQLSTTAGFASLVWERTVSFNQLNDANFTYNLMTNATNLASNTTYYYRIKTRYRLLNNYETPWKTGTFRTAAIDHKRWTYVNQANTAVPMGNFRDMVVEPSGRIWVATYTGLYSSDDGVNWTLLTTKTTGGVLPDGGYAIGRGASGLIAVSTTQGVYRYNAASNTWTGLGNPNGATNGFYAIRLLIDKSDRIYITTASDVFVYDRGSWRTVTKPVILTNKYLSAATIDGNDNLWLLTSTYDVVCYDGTTWTTVPAANLPQYYYPYGIVTDNTGAVWTHGPYGIAKLNADLTWQHSSSSTFGTNGTYVIIYQLAFDKQNHPVTVSAYDLHRQTSAGWQRLGSNALLTGSYSGRMAVDAQDRVVVASTLSGLTVYDGRTITPSLVAASPSGYCVGSPVSLTFAANFTPKGAYQLQLSDTGGTQFTPISGTISGATATLTLPLTLPTGAAYRLRLVSSDPAIIGDETPAFTVNSLPVIRLTPAASQTICSTESLVLTADAGSGATYQWLKDGTAVAGATTASYSTTVTGTYTVRAELNGCTANSALIPVTVKEGAVATVTPQGATTVYSPNSVTLLANTGTGYSYQWQKDNVLLAGATAPVYEAKVTGAYRVSIVNSVGCPAVSPTVAVHIEQPLAVLPFTNDDLLLMPNPADYRISLIMSRTYPTADLTLTDETGRVLGRYTMAPYPEPTDLDLTRLASGAYILTIRAGEQTYVRRFIKR